MAIETEKEHRKTKRAVTWFVFISLIASAVYAIVGIILADPGSIPDVPHGRVKSDYTLMLLQCLLGIAIMFLPSILKKRRKLAITNRMHILFVTFLYCAIVLGEVRSFYYKVPHWDSFLHIFSGAMLGVVGFSIIDTLNDNKAIRTHMTDKFVAVFSFCFALSLGTVWEIYEFAGDCILSLNMQKFALEDGTPLVGQLALQDTMKDLIVDAVGVLAVVVYAYLMAKRKRRTDSEQITI
ncbi:MAG: hypothetical protein LBO63_04095 [Oscillospiraceae bacterium]|jgi:uncharacterized membrane protein YjdF|nr:hypothetical protein [Oscillospiraceae bacterium]